MKKLFTILLLFVSVLAVSQNNGINFQGVGRNSSGAVLATTKISLRFSVIQTSETGTVEYVESKEVTTNAQGIFSVVVGDGTQTSKTGNFSDINWKINPKFLKVEMDPAGGSSFVAMGTTRLQAVPFAYYANGVNADNVDGVLSASKGGTGVASISALKTALAIDQINNTSDLAKPISTATQTALDTKVSTSTFSTTVATKANTSDLALKAPIDSPTFTGTVAGITKAMVGLGSVNNTSDLAKPISTLTQEALDTKVSTATFSTTVATKANATDLALKAPIESPTFTGTVAGITKAMVGLGSVNNTADLAKPISTATQEALDTKVSATTFSTTVANKANTVDLALKAPLESPTFTGTVTGITKAMVGLSDVENTADLAKPISTVTEAALDTKVSTATFSTTMATKENTANKSTATDLGGLNPSDVLFPTQKAVKNYITANTASGNIADGGITTIKLANGAVTNEKIAIGISKSKVGLNNVENTADLDKPISTATQIALDAKVSSSTYSTSIALKAPLESPTFSGTVSGITKAMVGLTDVDNTSDLGKPISTATQTALNLKVSTSTFSSTLAIKEDISKKSIAIDLGGSNPSDDLYPSQKAVKTYVTANLSNGIADGSVSTVKLADGSVTGVKLASSIAGYKNFVAGAGKVITSSNATLDLILPTGSVATGGSSVWQSFVPTASGKLSIVEFETGNPTNLGGMPPIAYVEIYAGEGIGGTLLGRSNDFTISMFGRTWKSFEFNATIIELYTGNTYTARLVTSTSNQIWVYGDNNLYNDGKTNVSSTWDHNFKTSLKVFTNDEFLTTTVGQNLISSIVSNATHTGEVTGATSLTITDGVVSTAKISDGAVTTAKLANTAVDLTTKVTGLLPTANIADGAITTAKLANTAVDLTTKVTGLLSTANIADGAITTAKIANAAVDLTTKVTGLLPTSNIADGAVTTAKIANTAVDLTTKVTGLLPTSNGGTGTLTATSNMIFASPNGTNGAPSFRTLVASDIPTNLTGYIQNNPGSAQTASININGTINAGGIQNSPIGNITPNSGTFTSLTTSGTASIGGTLTVTGIANFTQAPILANATASKALFTNSFKEIVSNNITGSGNVVMSTSPTLTGTATFETLTTNSDIIVNGKKFGRGAGDLITNTVIGLDAFTSNTTGEGNISIGSSALKSNTIGYNNIALGTLTLNKNTSGSGNFAAGYTSLMNNLTGQSNFSSGWFNLYKNTSGSDNFSIGNSGLYENTTGSNNFAVGKYVMVKNTVGSENVAIGFQSLNNNSNGNNNIAVGRQSSANTTTGSNNIAFGYQSLIANLTGENNIAMGYNTLYSSTIGQHNFAAGYESLKNNLEGSNNVGIGLLTLNSNTYGNDNIAIGWTAGYRITIGSNNILLGSNTGENLSIGSNNLFLGRTAGSNMTTGSNNIILGNNAQATTATVDNQITLGNSSITSLRAQVTSITALSDRRDKTDIKTIAEGIDFIKNLKPVTYTWNTRDKSKVGIKAAGFIAQDLLNLQKSSSIGDNLDLVSEDNPEKLEARYNNLLPVMVKAIQDQQVVIEELKKELEALKKLIQKP
jgi:hypothetical protein